MREQIKWQTKRAAVYHIASFILSCVIVFSCSDQQEKAPPQMTTSSDESFTFFDIGRTTTLTKSVRKSLNTKLGRDAIEYRSIIDLKINYPGFLQQYFPEIHELNQQLNYPPGERIEHNTVKLMYRYAQKKNIPFDYVELVFSDYTQNPIVFRIHFKEDDSNIIETLKSKYGEPTSIDWNLENGQSIFWEKNQDYLIVSLVPDQFGQHEHQVVIYFAENLRTLIDTERAEKQKREEERAKSGEKAF
ncbi:MAG: hypothetical protein PVG44_18910 [Desulfobacterales bacterium]|jgi:hypothetical protein